MDRYPSRLDHLVYATPDVEETIRDLSEKTGVVAQHGGAHPALGTRNAIFALGRWIYMEIMGPDQDHARAGNRPFYIDQLEKPSLATWVARSDDLQSVVEIGRRVGVELGEIRSGNRRKPDGSLLTWNMTDLLAEREEGMIPYFIDWGSSPHPAQNAPEGCLLHELKATHPDPTRIKALLQAFGIDLHVEYGRHASLVATVETPNGSIEIR